MVSERLRAAELQAELSSSVQEKLTAEGQRERLELEIQHLKEQLKWHQEQLSSTKGALTSSQKPEQPAAHMESRLSLMERTKEELLDKVIGIKHALLSFPNPIKCLTCLNQDENLSGPSRLK